MAARGAATAASAALMAVASAAVMIESAAATVATVAAVMLVSDAAATPAATQSVMNLRRSPCSKNWKPYKIETKDIGIQAYYAILQLCVGCQLMV